MNFKIDTKLTKSLNISRQRDYFKLWVKVKKFILNLSLLEIKYKRDVKRNRE